MNYNKAKLIDIIEKLERIQEYDYITYPTEDEEKVKIIMNNIEKEIEIWEKLQDSNYSY